MHLHSIPTVCLRSTSAGIGPPKPDFPAALSTASRKPQMDTSGLELTEACYRFDGFSFRPVSFTPIAASSNVPILQLLTDAGGKLWIRPQGTYLVRQKDGQFESLPPIRLYGGNHRCVSAQQQRWRSTRFRHQIRAHFVSWQTRFQKLGPSSPQVVSTWQKQPMARFGWAHSAMASLFLTGGRATNNVDAGFARPKDQFSAADRGRVVGFATDTAACITRNANGFRRSDYRRSSQVIVQVLSILRWIATRTCGLGTDACGLSAHQRGKAFSFSEENELRGDGAINVFVRGPRRQSLDWRCARAGPHSGTVRARGLYSSVSDRRFRAQWQLCKYVDLDGPHLVRAPAQGVGCMFSTTAAFNPLHRYHQIMWSIPSVDGQMRCGPDVNAGG